MMPLVSVVVPVYNSIKYLAQCLDSVLDQTYKNIEIICIDDGSSDGSLTVLNQYAEENDRLSVFSQYHQNASIARNLGMSYAHGEYMIFIDSDDVMLPNAIETLVNVQKETYADLVMGNIQDIDVNGNPIGMTVEFYEYCDTKPFMTYLGEAPAPTNKLYRVDIIKNNNIVWGNVRIAQDLNFYYKYLACCEKIVVIPEIIYQWRDVPTGMSSSTNLNIFDITESFSDIRHFYNSIGLKDIYDNYIVSLEYHHYHRQMEKQYRYSSRKIRRLIVEYFSIFLKRLNPTDCVNYQEYAQSIRACKVKLTFKRIYSTWLYQLYKNRA